MRNRLLLGALWGIVLCTAQTPSHAQGTYGGVSVNAYTEVGAIVRLQDVSVKARLEKGVAKTDMTLILDHDLVEAAQMTVNLTVHKDAVITGYSYWFKGEQVDAKLLDNDEAWEIYRTVTSRGRDPAIMEQWGETNYHFQIFPVEPKVPLKMVIHYLQPWESDAESFYYRPPFPVQADKLRHYDAEVRLPGMNVVGLRSNMTDGFTMESDGPVYRLEKKDWRPEDNWRIRIGHHHGKGLNVLASGGRSGGKAGFFYLLLAPPKVLGPSKIRLSGVQTWDVMPRANGGLQHGYGWLVTGRYKGSGILNITLQPKRGRALTAAVRLTSASMPNGPATKFWGTRAVKRAANATSIHQTHGAGISEKRRDQVIRLSQRFGVVSAYTAWLAIPKSELDFYKKLKEDPKFREEQEQRRLETQRQRAQANQARTNAQAARGGDPLIRITTTPDIRKVTAILPTGESIPLVRKPGGFWEARFDIPWGTAEGAYEVVILLQSEDGSRKRVTLTYQIDRTPGTGSLTLEAGSLTVQASDDIQRVTARLSNGARYELKRNGATFTGQLPGDVSGPVEVTLIDRAHNITVLYVDPR